MYVCVASVTGYLMALVRGLDSGGCFYQSGNNNKKRK